MPPQRRPELRTAIARHRWNVADGHLGQQVPPESGWNNVAAQDL